MSRYPALAHLSAGPLVDAAGDDPWQIDETLQRGDPGEIAALSRAFFEAGACTEETYRDFVAAQQRFRAAWSRADGAHPISDGGQVRRALDSVLFQRDQLPVVAAELATVAAALAEAQRCSAGWIDSLDEELHTVDHLIGQALRHRRDPSALADRAVASTIVVVSQVHAVRDGYAADLAAATTALRADSHFDPAIDDVDGDDRPGPGQPGPDALDYYERHQLAADQAAGGGEAAARLRDFRTATDPVADESARDLAVQRLADFAMSRFVGPLPVDPVLGGDPRTRALARVDLQHRLETGALGLAPMAADEATRRLDDAEHEARVLSVREAVATFTGLGMTAAGARRCVDLLSRGTPMREVLDQNSTMLAAVEAGSAGAARSLPTGRHAVQQFSANDLRVLTEIGRTARLGGGVIDVATGFWDWHTGQTTVAGAAGRVAGGMAAGWAAQTLAWAGAGSFLGPEGALVAGLIASVVFSGVGADAGEKVFDELAR